MTNSALEAHAAGATPAPPLPAQFGTFCGFGTGKAGRLKLPLPRSPLMISVLIPSEIVACVAA
jgi:hypothetical protein